MTRHRPAIISAARVAGLEWQLVEALVMVESGGIEWAWNPEPRYRYVWNVRSSQPFRKLSDLEIASNRPPVDFPSLIGDPDQEWWGQRASWGLMQVMGAVARERGYIDPYLTSLCYVESNLRTGCGVLSALLKRASGDEEMALAMYNGGAKDNTVRPFRNAAYAEKVLKQKALLA